eukprot:gene5158-10306_t
MRLQIQLWDNPEKFTYKKAKTINSGTIFQRLAMTLDSSAISFKNLTFSKPNSKHSILNNISGYVSSGGLTAVIGASASGKSLLMKALSGRIQNMDIKGNVFVNGVEVDPKCITSNVGYVPQDDILLGELTPREMLTNAALMKRNKPVDMIASDVDSLLQAIGLRDVADNSIGTVFVRGLSGGQKKRVDVGLELVAAPHVLMLDEPTSGLDASIALEVLTVVKNIAKASQGKLSVLLSIHQPNSRILELFDNILIIGLGEMIFFGSVSDSVQYFTQMGFPPPQRYTPSDFYLQITDHNFGCVSHEDIIKRFQNNQLYDNILHKIDSESLSKPSESIAKATTEDDKYACFVDDSHGASSFWRQYYTLVKRDFILAARDPALYYLQMFLCLSFGFLIGAAFFQMKYEIGSKINNPSGALLWIVMMVSYIQIFKVYHLCRGYHRFRHERANNSYPVLVAFLAETTTTSILVMNQLGGCAIAYFMMGFPGKAFPFLILNFWVTTLAAEAVVFFVSKLHHDTTVCIIASEAILSILTVFGGGVFIPWNATPFYWHWLQESSLFAQGSRAAIINVLNVISYECVLTDGHCVAPDGAMYPCDGKDEGGDGGSGGRYCYVSGRTVLHETQDISYSMSHWDAFGYLVLIYVCFRLAGLVLMFFPLEVVMYRLTSTVCLFYTSSKSTLNGSSSISSTGSNIDEEASPGSVRGQEGQLVISHASMMNLSTIFKEKVVTTSTSDADAASYDIESTAVSLDDVFAVDTSRIASTSCLMWESLSLKLKSKGTMLIDNVSGIAKCGRVLALMGPSGAGKTTLLNALGNRAPYATLTGKISFGNRTFLPSDLFYVPQFDEFNKILSVKEQINFVGHMQCTDMIAMKKRLEQLIDVLGLRRIADKSCVNLTGGELKRVSVGMGMISNPRVLFLDEPTTGLDSAAAYSMVKFMVELAEKTNVAVITTIHQPAEMVFDMLPDLLILEKGRLAYSGPTLAVERYFASLGYIRPMGITLADFCLDLVNGTPKHCDNGNNNDKDVTWESLYLSTEVSTKVRRLHAEISSSSKTSSQTDPRPSEIVRLEGMVTYFGMYYSREFGFHYLRLLFLLMLAFYCGTVFLDLQPRSNNLQRYAGAIFVSIWIALIGAIPATGLLERDHRQVVEQVKNAIVTPGIYCLAQFLVSVPFLLGESLMFQSIFHWLSNINPDGEVFTYTWLLTTAHLLMMEALLLCVVQVLRNAMLSVTFAIVVLGTVLLFSGFFIEVKNEPDWISWLSYIVPTKYSFDGLLYEIFHSQNFEIPNTGGQYLPGDVVLSTLFGQIGSRPWEMLLTLLAWVALIRISHYFLLLYEVYQYLPSSFAKISKSSISFSTINKATAVVM